MAFADDYVSVNVRIEQFLAKFPDGRIQTEIAKHTDDIVIMRATVYRDPDDTRPSIAHSQLGIPGKTNFTRDSEVENAETSAVGRALAFMGFETKKGLASREEVASRHHAPPATPQADRETGEMQPYVGPHAAGGSNWQQLQAAMKDAGLRSPVVVAAMAPDGKFSASGLDEWLGKHPDMSIHKLIDEANRIAEGAYQPA